MGMVFIYGAYLGNLFGSVIIHLLCVGIIPETKVCSTQVWYPRDDWMFSVEYLTQENPKYQC